MGASPSAPRCCASRWKGGRFDEERCVPKRVAKVGKFDVDLFVETSSHRRQKNGAGSSDKGPDWIEQAFTEEVAVLVSDLSGFTKMTRKYGIQHFASIIVRKRQLCAPILARYEVVHTCYEADNLMCVFRDAVKCTKAATEMQHVIREYNKSLEEGREHFRITLNGIGVHVGYGLLIDKMHGMHGEAFSHAYKIGEDEGEGGVVMITDEIKSRIETDPFFSGAVFTEYPSKEYEFPLYSIEGQCGPLEAALVPFDDDRYLHKELLRLTRRHDSTIDLSVIDEELRKACMAAWTVLMFNFDVSNGADEQAQVALKFHGLDILRPICDRHKGKLEEDMLWLFENPLNALLAAFEVRQTLHAHNTKEPDAHQYLKIRGYGIHVGQLLFIDGTDIHWGDPVNTSSKLGQDLAQHCDILLTPEAMEAVEADTEYAKLNLEKTEKNLYRSGVELQCFSMYQGTKESILEEKCMNFLFDEVGNGVLETIAALIDVLKDFELPPPVNKEPHNKEEGETAATSGAPQGLPAFVNLGAIVKQGYDEGRYSSSLMGFAFEDAEVIRQVGQLAKFAGAASCTKATEVVEHTPGLTAESSVKHIEAPGKECPGFFIAEENAETKSFVLTIRGASNMSECLADLARGTVALGQGAGRVPESLQKSADSVLKLARPHLDKLEPQRLVCVGHGSGAALAILVTLHLLFEAEKDEDQQQAKPKWVEALRAAVKAGGENIKELLQCYAFGPPPCFFPQAAAPLSAQQVIFTIVNGNDCVPRASPASAMRLKLALAEADKQPSSGDERISYLAGEISSGDIFADRVELPEGWEAKGGGRSAVGTVLHMYPKTDVISATLFGQEASRVCELLTPDTLDYILVHPSACQDHMLSEYEATAEKLAASFVPAVVTAPSDDAAAAAASQGAAPATGGGA